ncbi:MAG TPA: 16S rRNA (adenine(1518)-N(6)/adenine(1519)-N(6))-dimethyltransferase RsmA [Syntrophaceticus sp.]|jgi:16S rRNA (adenine1518-N6/adenine1519-N6)-dimethyltransferase|uniref:Ribosomal RNA small subunit methyltransferase A n=1 Tax=Syntrophaceticus schinkii TaxID=499207 RepID=A0A0B7MI38_9FIRM|nr:16S rRNA (adenine(1518)-N(6)/adenine(1519)-N(6))-dimethyltransferase RsmA [Syntrophaceticus schinkii]HHY30566.1 16S rRNA (adenine(1518)-N(6)/adenine(1519)-N(6))-dimethyltransferase RsmA [Syntrophaceticus sp.]MDD2359619.1 16S rRNA (adenine(1518)-N(6)/adenine(1519)-N(6))-dimethyltransferase RsmA [Syntrophaceticus schinkii]MDD4262183.1 16S rRNA (adenine(1518)-N(6)/adenine(1519)-N(6))-dimethyltransferase RsmA [Syntrophaceticus schinkii]MDD4674397.1 16S rRNA (adenine(1518)-N(6)/adenine(1519)-N(6)
MADIASPTALKSLLRNYGLTPKKGLGQHFLWQTQVVERIASAAELTKNDVVLEIGPGLGILTAALARRAGLVIAVEIDRALFPLLEEILCDYDNVRLVEGDARKVDFGGLLKDYASAFTGPCKVVGNLPYYITSPLIMRLLYGEFRKELLVFMVQKEVAKRIAACPGGKEYGSLSVAVQYLADPEFLFQVPPHAFCPPPDVASAVIKLTSRQQPAVSVKDEEIFFKVVRAAFRYRRKMLRNALREADLWDPEGDNIFEWAGIIPERRGETLDLVEFSRLADALAYSQERKEEQCTSLVQPKEQ